MQFLQLRYYARISSRQGALVLPGELPWQGEALPPLLPPFRLYPLQPLHRAAAPQTCAAGDGTGAVGSEDKPRRGGCQAGGGGAERGPGARCLGGVSPRLADPGGGGARDGAGGGGGGSAEQREAGLAAGRAVSEVSRAEPPLRCAGPLPGGTGRDAAVPERRRLTVIPPRPGLRPQAPSKRRRPLPAARRPTHRRGTRRRRRFPRRQPQGPRCLFPPRPALRPLTHPRRGRPARAPPLRGLRGGPALAAAARPGGRRYVTRAAAGTAGPPCRPGAAVRGAVREAPPRAAGARAGGPARPGPAGPVPAAGPGAGRPGALQAVPARRQAGGRGHRQQVSAGTALFLAE